jgi:nitric oxide dioxygenase
MEDLLYRQIVEGSPDAVVFGDAEGTIRLWNAGAEAVFIPERLRGRHWDGYRRTMATGVSRYGAGDLLAVPAVTKDGRSISIEFTIQMLKGPAGEILGPVAAIRDVTKRFQREKEMARRIKELEASASR